MVMEALTAAVRYPCLSERSVPGFLRLISSSVAKQIKNQ